MPQSTSQCMLALMTLTALLTQTNAQITSAPVATAAAPVDWTTAVTWPAGCEKWANPCPAGAKTSGVAPSPAVVTWPAGCQTWANPCPASAVISAAPASWSSASDYTNGFTSYTTMTNSNGIITGMPAVATVAGGVSSVLSQQSVALHSTPTTLSTMTSIPSSNASSATSAVFSFAQASASTTSAPYKGGAATDRVVSTAAVLTVAGLVVALLL